MGRGLEAVREHGTVVVRNGEYDESLSVDKPVSLLGEDRDSTVIHSDALFVLEISAGSVTVSGFTILCENHDTHGSPVWLDQSSYCTITDNLLT